MPSPWPQPRSDHDTFSKRDDLLEERTWVPVLCFLKQLPSDCLPSDYRSSVVDEYRSKLAGLSQPGKDLRGYIHPGIRLTSVNEFSTNWHKSHAGL
jgi:hypothetical protein